MALVSVQLSVRVKTEVFQVAPWHVLIGRVDGADGHARNIFFVAGRL